MRFNLRQATWALAINVALLVTPGVASTGQDRGQDYRPGDQQNERHDNQQGDRHDDRDRNGVPSGGYMQTCQDIRTDGTTLLANCKKRNGKWKQSSLRNFNECPSEIENSNGRLVCGK
jgi:CVNH domain